MILSMKVGACAAALIAGLVLTACAPQGDEDPLPTPTATRTVVTKTAVPLPKLPHHEVAWPSPRLSVEENTLHLGGRAYDVSPLRADAAAASSDIRAAFGVWWRAGFMPAIIMREW